MSQTRAPSSAAAPKKAIALEIAGEAKNVAGSADEHSNWIRRPSLQWEGTRRPAHIAQRPLPSFAPHSEQYRHVIAHQKTDPEQREEANNKTIIRISPVSEISLRMIGRRVVRDCGQRKPRRGKSSYSSSSLRGSDHRSRHRAAAGRRAGRASLTMGGSWPSGQGTATSRPQVMQAVFCPAVASGMVTVRQVGEENRSWASPHRSTM